MSAAIWIAIGTALGVISPLLYQRWRRPALPGRSMTHSKSKSRPERASKRAVTAPAPGFAAVEIRPCLEACRAAWSLEARRYLQAEAPALPLAGCDAATCSCRYIKYRDRRAGDDRRFFAHPLGGTGIGGVANRRDGQVDRRDDPESDF